MSKALLFLPSPRDIPEVKASVDKLKIDKLWCKYYPQEEAYQTARDWFLRHYEYSHLIIHPDDMITTQDNLDLLLTHIGKGAVVSGWTSNTTKENWKELNHSNLSYTLPPNPPHAGKYEDFNFIPVKEIEDPNIRTYLWKVKFLGFSLQLIPRRILEQIPFRGDQDCCIDSCFSLDLHYNMFEQFADIRIRSKHLPFETDILVGKKEKEIILECKK